MPDPLSYREEYDVVWDGRSSLYGDPVAAVNKEVKIAESKSLRSAGLRRFYRDHPEHRNKIAAAVKKHWTSVLTPEQRVERGRQISKGKRNATARLTPAQRQVRRERQVKSRRQQWETQRAEQGFIARRTKRMLQTMSLKTPIERQAMRAKISESMKAWKRSRTAEELSEISARVWAARRAHYGPRGAP